ncbi:PD-(D/E)XK nuclease family protein, partial [Elusimicrobiota bacterium]
MKDVEFTTVSTSKMKLYLLCPRRYYYAYGEGIFQEDTPATLFGNYIHSVLEDYLKQLIKNWKKKDLQALYAAAQFRKKEYPGIPETGNLSFFDCDVILNKFASRDIDPEKIFSIEKFFKLPLLRIDEPKIVGR